MPYNAVLVSAGKSSLSSLDFTIKMSPYRKAENIVKMDISVPYFAILVDSTNPGLCSVVVLGEQSLNPLSSNVPGSHIIKSLSVFLY